MQTLLDQRDRANAILIAALDTAGVEHRLRQSALVDDFGLRVRALDALGVIAVESRSTILSDAAASAAIRVAERVGLHVIPTLTYLANSIRAGERAIPYSTITAIDLASLGWVGAEAQNLKPGAIVLNDWAAKDLRVAVGDAVSVDYYVWEADGRLRAQTTEFRLARIVPMMGPAADRDLVPEYPGITDSDRVADWDPPFPIDLNRVRPIDEEYWNRHRATPKAFIPIQRGQQLWSSRHGGLTALRLVPPEGTPLGTAREQFEKALLGELDPLATGFSVYDVRAQGLAASSGATDFGEYFTYFSTFLVVSALLLAGLFFKLGVEQRLQEVGLLQALGLDPAAIRRLFVGEALFLAGIGGALGIAGAIAYSALIMLGLRTWWVDAVGTTALTLHVDPISLVAGALAVVAIAVASIWWTLRALATASTRSLLKGSDSLFTDNVRNSRPLFAGVVAGVLAIALLAGSAFGAVPRVAGFFGAGALSLVAMLCLACIWLRRGRWGSLHGHGKWAVCAWDGATRLPAGAERLCIASSPSPRLSSSRSSVQARRTRGARRPPFGGGGYPLLVETLLPIVHNLNDAAGARCDEHAGGTPATRSLDDRFRVRPGDDTSCLNLYQPKNPRLVAATQDFINSGRFAFHSSLAESPEERANPGCCSIASSRRCRSRHHRRQLDDYVLHMKLATTSSSGVVRTPDQIGLVAALSR